MVRKALFVLCLMVSSVVAGAAPPAVPAKAGMDESRLKMVAERMKQAVDRGEIAGAVALAARNGQVAVLETAGYQDLEARKPMRADSIFQIMSMTKPLTGVAIMMLLEEGKLSLNDPVERHLPEFRGQMVIHERRADGSLVLKKPARPITIRDLMAHVSGLSGQLPAGVSTLYSDMQLKLGEAVKVFSQQPLQFEPGTKWMYSNMGIATLGRIVEVLSDQPFETFLAERLLKPLGMKDSFLFPPAGSTERIAINYVRRDGKLVRAPADSLGGDSAKFRKGAVYSAPEFGLYSTAEDLSKFYQMMLNGGASNGRRYLSKASVETMTRLHTGELQAGHNPGMGFGLTWEVVKEPLGEGSLLSIGTFKHGGAFGTHGWVDPQRGIVGVFLVQGGNHTPLRDAIMQIVAASITGE